MALTQQVEELVLLKCSLLTNEVLEFVLSHHEDYEAWIQVVNAHSEGDLSPSCVSSPAHFTVRIQDIPIWFEIHFPSEYPSDTTEFTIMVRGYNLSKVEQQQWQDVIANKRGQINQTSFPAYELISLHLLPLLHEKYDGCKSSEVDSMHTATLDLLSEPTAHALLTSHHLKSPHKRRSLRQWSSELCLSGFAKVGYPGLIYCSGLESNVKDFVSRVRSMQWLALRVRFVDSLPRTDVSPTEQRSHWIEVEKVGEVMDEMRRLGRESFVLDLGIGNGEAK